MVISEYVTGIGFSIDQRVSSITANLWMGLDLDRVPYLVMSVPW
jgi:hypothetical protein